jgi:trans-aconitate methyltransferase
MSTSDLWKTVWARKGATDVSWFQAEATTSLALIEASGTAAGDPIVDVGAGASRLVDGLLERGHFDVTLLDLAAESLGATADRLGPLGAGRVAYVTADVTTWSPPRRYALWHDRAVFHFLVEPDDRAAYLQALRGALRAGGAAVVAAFADDGPERCSGLAVQRYNEASLAAALSPVLRLVEPRREVHRTPGGAEQRFVYGRFVRAG